MKKIIFSLIAVMAGVSINAQQLMVLKTTDNGTSWSKVQTYTNSATEQYKVVFGEVTTGTAKATLRTNTTETGTEADVQWVQLWKNGPKWAVFNVGATSVGQKGGLYNWGKSVNRSSDGSYSSSTADIQGGNDDTAKNLWGNNWQMPKKTDFDNLLSNCTVTWTTQNGVNGCLFTGKGNYSFNSVFFPAAGFFYNGQYSTGAFGCYWSSTRYNSSSKAYNLYFFSSSSRSVPNNVCNSGFSVRAILKE